MEMTEDIKVGILLSCFNGEKYIKDQVDSFIAQTHSNWTLFVRDDGSSDETINILKNYQNEHASKIIILENNQNLGINKSYEQLIHSANNCDYYMFSDQDDVWKPNKIKILLDEVKNQTEEQETHKPLLIHSDLEVTDENLNIIYKSFWDTEKLKPHYSNKLNYLLLQNYIVGCSTLFNKELLNILKISGIPNEARMHDHWAGLIAAIFGKIFISRKKLTLHRQHENNDTGIKPKTLLKDFQRIFMERNISNSYNIEAKLSVVQAKKLKLIFQDSIPKQKSELIENFIRFYEEPSFLKIFKYKFFKSRLISNIHHIYQQTIKSISSQVKVISITFLRAFASLASFVTIGLITNNLSPKLAGEFFLFLGFVLPASMLARFGTDSVTSRNIARNLGDNKIPDEINIIQCLITTSIGCLFFSILIFIALQQYSLTINNSPALLYFFTFFILLFFSFEKPVSEILLMQKKYYLSQILQFCIVPIFTLFIMLATKIDNNIVNVFFVYFIGSSLFFVGIFFIKINWHKVNIKYLNFKKNYLKQSFNVLATVFVGILLSQSIIPLVSLSEGTDTIATLTILMRLTAIVTIFASIVKNANAYLFAVNLEIKNLQKVNSRLNNVLSLLIVICGLYFIALIYLKELIFSFFGTNYVISTNILLVFCIAFFVHVLSINITNVLIIAKKENIIWKISLVSGLLSIILIFWLTPIYGIFGAGLGLMAGYLFDFIFQFYFVKRYLSKKDVTYAQK